MKARWVRGCAPHLFSAVVFMVYSVLFCCPSEGKDLTFSRKNNRITANLNEMSVQAVLERLKAEKGVWFEGDESYLKERKVSVELKDVPLVEGVKRILTNLNYCLIYDKEGRMRGIRILGRSGAGGRIVDRTPKKGPSPEEKRAQAAKPEAKLPGSESPKPTLPPGFEVVKDAEPPGGRVPQKPLPGPGMGGEGKPLTQGKPGAGPASELFKPQGNVPPPGGPVDKDAAPGPEFQVDPNAPSPGS